MDEVEVAPAEGPEGGAVGDGVAVEVVVGLAAVSRGIWDGMDGLVQVKWFPQI